MRNCSFTFWFLALSCTSTTVTDGTWVDPDTPVDAYHIIALAEGDTRIYDIVFSDEFEVDGRTYTDGHDPRWTAMDKTDFTNNPLHYYSSESVTTSNGSMGIQVSVEPKHDLFDLDKNNTIISQSKEFKSGMLQSWDKFCFTGGIVEFSVKLPGKPNVGGLWPAIWMMGNLGRATFINSTENVWPFSTNTCDDRSENSQLMNSCSNEANETLQGIPAEMLGQGRGSPEIDLLEVMYMDMFDHPVLSQSLQVAPGVPVEQRPVLGQLPNASQTWYQDIEYGTNVSQNIYFYGTKSWPADPTKNTYLTDSLSATMELNDDFYNSFHTFRVEWEPPLDDDDDDDEDGTGSTGGGYLKWYVDDKFVTGVYGTDLYETSQTEIPNEAMYLVMNLAVSKDWGFPDAWFLNCPKKCWSCLDPECRSCAMPHGFCENLPASFEIDSVRVYQPRGQSQYSLGCSPVKRPTKEYIEVHMDKYKRHEDERPIKEVQKGGGLCLTTEDDCGTTKRGHCATDGTCICKTDWTGPHCLAHNGADGPTPWAHIGGPGFQNDEEESDDDLKKKQRHHNTVIGWTLFLILSLMMVLFVPLKPFFRPNEAADGNGTYVVLPTVPPRSNNDYHEGKKEAAGVDSTKKDHPQTYQKP